MIKLPPFDLYAGNTADRNSTNFPKRGNALAYVDTEAGVFHVHVAGSWVALGGGIPEPPDDAETYGRKTDGASSWVAVVPKDGGEYTGAVTISLAGTEYLMLDSPADTTSTPSVQFKRNGNLRWQIRQGSFTNNSLTIRRYNNSGTFQDTPIHLDDSTGYVGIQGVPSTSHVINGGVVFNEPGAAVNHRFEGDNDANLLFLDGANDRVGMGTATPGAKVHAVGSGEVIRVQGSGTGDANLAWVSICNSAGTRVGFFGDAAGGDSDLYMAADGGGLRLYANGGTRVRIFNGVVVGSPTGGDKGIGTVNAQALYDDNVLLSDYILDLYYDGRMNDEDAERHPNGRIWSLEDTAVFTKQNRHLPTMPGRKEWESGARSLGELVTALWQTVEQQQLQIFELNNQLKAVTNG